MTKKQMFKTKWDIETEDLTDDEYHQYIADSLNELLQSIETKYCCSACSMELGAHPGKRNITIELLECATVVAKYLNKIKDEIDNTPEELRRQLVHLRCSVSTISRNNHMIEGLLY